MTRWLPRIVLLVTLAGVLAMHGFDAGAHGDASKPAMAPAGAALASDHGHLSDAATERQASAPSAPAREDDGKVPLSHGLAMVCVAALVTAAAVLTPRLVARRPTASYAPISAAAPAGRAAIDVFAPLPPAWVRLCVIRR